jgi:hypothetical protein
MASLILLTILPTGPRDPQKFNSDLNGLVIDVFDLTVNDSVNGVKLGSATGVTSELFFQPLTIVPGSQGHPDTLKTQIIQHFNITQLDPVTGLPVADTPWSVATAVIIIDRDPSPPDPEYDSSDLRITISRDGHPLKNTAPIEFNASVLVVGSLSNNPQDYISWAATAPQPASYIFVPPRPPQSSTIHDIEISADGKTPVFKSLIDAVNAVLRDDNSTTSGGPSDLQTRKTPLTQSQAQQVASELIYNKSVLPLPTPKQALESMYSDPNVATKDDQNRVQFEGELKAYHATHDAEALQLSAFILNASTAIKCEILSLQAATAGLTVGVEVAPPPPRMESATFSALLKGVADSSNPNGYLKPSFGVPAAFFYVLGSAVSSGLNSDQRYHTAIIASEEANLQALQSALDVGILEDTESTITTSVLDTQVLTIDQAARRLSALGFTNRSVFTTNLDDKVSAVVADWLGYTGKTTDIDKFWAAESTGQNFSQYLEILLQKITAEKTLLKTEITDPTGTLHVQRAADLLSISDQGWTNFFIPPPPASDADRATQATLLPNYTAGGKTEERVRKFIADLKTLFAMTLEKQKGEPPSSGDIPTLSRPQQDALQLFLNQDSSFDFAKPLDAAAESTISSILSSLPMSASLQKWTNDAIHLINFLVRITTFSAPSPPELQFSYMEALYSRGFVTLNRISVLSRTQFQAALAGTIAYPADISNAIYDLATNKQADPSPGPEPGTGFTPINSGELANCLPSPNVSPFGLIEYLHELLQLSISAADGSGDTTISQILLRRRGPVGTLKNSSANLDLGLPAIDLVNESLEGLFSANSGRVFDTIIETLSGFDLGEDPGKFDPELALNAIPEYSTPALLTKTAPTTVYQSLTTDFSAPNLPYSQSLDANRTYFSRLGLSRFEAMQVFRRNITEFALDPTHDPIDFRSDLWRLPLRLEIAKEYLEISEEELETLFQSTLEGETLANIYGFASSSEGWISELSTVDVFLERTGLSYCEFYELWKCGYVRFRQYGTETGVFPKCPPCCLSSLRIQYEEKDGVASFALQKIAVFIRLWRKLQARYGKCCITLSLLAAICELLGMFVDDQLNPLFIRNLLSLLILCDIFCIPLCVEPGVDSEAAPFQRVKILSLWADLESENHARDWAVYQFIDSIERYAKHRYHCLPRSAEAKKFLASNLDDISKIAGFNDGSSWNTTCECTLRFAEILAKIYASPFTAGEILFLFTTAPHLLGDDPFPSTESSESIEDPLNSPEDDRLHGLWHLRKKLLEVEVQSDEVECWTWERIEHFFRKEFSLGSSGHKDTLQLLGEHFFPDLLESCGCPVSPEKRQFHTPLAASDTSALMWESWPHGPFHYRVSTEQLWAVLPITDDAVLKKICHIRQLKSSAQHGQSEQEAVRELYFAPRAMLAPFSCMFSNFTEAVEELVQESCESKRFEIFQRNFAKFHQRCQIIAEHLAKHVQAVPAACEEGKIESCDTTLAWRVLRSLFADENRADGHWEMDSGKLPDDDTFHWNRKLSGSAFGAILGLIGTGLQGEFGVKGSVNLIWREVRAPLDFFGAACNQKNAPIPTVIPSLSLPASAVNASFVALRNGFGLNDSTAEQLGGAQPFSCQLNGVLLVDCHGDYKFHLRIPAPHCKHHEKGCSCHERHLRWLITLSRGQKTWTILNHKWDSMHQNSSHESLPIYLSKGAYEICINYEQADLGLLDDQDLVPNHTGFSVLYCGPDTEENLICIPINKLFVQSKDSSLNHGIESLSGSSLAFLKDHYVSSLRDIRRTYLRAFKATLIAHRFCLSPQSREYCHGESEAGFLLDHPENFLGTSYYRSSKPSVSAAVVSTATASIWTAHHVNFDLNFLPVDDTYFPPTPVQDGRASPSPQRTSALFDCWERLYDYKHLAKTAYHNVCDKHRDWTLWRMFYEAATQQPTEANALLRYLGVDLSLAPLTLKYFDGLSLQTADLLDERWPIRIFHAWLIIQRMMKSIASNSFEIIRPDLWVSDKPDNIVDPATDPPLTGNNNLIQFVQHACISENRVRLFGDVKVLNDGLRDRARKAMIAYYCHLDRISLPFSSSSPSATSPQDLSDLLLQDVEAQLCTNTTRIQDGIRAAQTFVHRLSLGLEPVFTLSHEFVEKWESVFCNYEKWKVCARRNAYHENWIEWDELKEARKSEAFKFLENGLQRHDLAMPISSPGFDLDPTITPAPAKFGPALKQLQSAESAMLEAQTNSPDEGIGLIGVPAGDGQPSWLAPLPEVTITPPESSDPSLQTIGNTVPSIKAGKIEMVKVTASGENTNPIPLWFQTAIRLGTRFVRVAAAGLPLAGRSSFPLSEDSNVNCKCECGKDHPPVIDEYYFWLTDGKWFDGQYVIDRQNADLGVVQPDPTSDWDRAETLPALLHWSSASLIHLAWTRVHLGSFDPPRRSGEGAEYDPSKDMPTLTFTGRKADSLIFGAIDSSGGGFRYDLATDSAVLLPEVVPANFEDQKLPAPLSAYPYFIYFNPGAPLVPISPFATALAISGTLRSHCRFGEALAWCKKLFDPLTRQNDTWITCSSRFERGTLAKSITQSVSTTGDPLGTYPGFVRARAVLLEYTEILLEWGDTLLCKDTTGDTNQAYVLFNEAVRILGPAPLTSKGKGSNQTMTVENFVAAKAPLNPRLMNLYEKAYDKRDAVRNCLTSHRLWKNFEIRDAELGKECACQSSNEGFCGANSSCGSCCLPYRFSSMFPKSMETANMVKSFGGALLSAIEKGDSEYLAALRQTHETQLLELNLENKKNSFREADWNVQALDRQLEGAQTRLRYNTQLRDGGLNEGETAHVAQTGVALASRTSGNVTEGIGQGMNFIPDMTLGGAGAASSPVAINQIPLGTKLSQVFSAGARMMNTIGDISSTNAGLSATTAGWQRRADDWQHQIEVITIEISQIKRQQLASQRRRDMALRDLNNHQEQIQHSAEIEDFIRDKLTKQDLYIYLQKETASLYRRAYDLALQTAADAQIAFQYERRDLPVQLPVASWDNLHEGLLAGERLELTLQSMHRQYMKTNCREYELTKHLSLRLHFPLAFLQLKALGWCEIEMPEWMFDLDYPGHYMRRIKNLSVTIPCIVGPYVGVHCRLQLLSSGIRLDPSLPNPQTCCCSGECSDEEARSYDDYKTLSRQFIGSEAIATSTGQNDSGLFELNFHDERFVPFEFAGAVSRWRIELPPENNQFGLDSVSDLVLHLNYTAREGGALLRRAANKAAQRHLPGDGIRFFDVRHEFPEFWSGIFAPSEREERSSPGFKHHRKEKKSGLRNFPLRFSRRTFPFLTGRRSVTITSIRIFVETERAVGDECAEHFTAYYIPEYAECDEDKKKIVCVAGEDMPRFYEGVLEVCLGPVEDLEYQGQVFGYLKFPEVLKRAGVRQVYLLCRYVVGDSEERCEVKSWC